MRVFQSQTVAEQLAEHLKRELMEGGFRGCMPGVLRLEAELGCNRKTVEEALRRLEAQGFLQSQGQGRPRVIVEHLSRLKALRIGLLHYEPNDRGRGYGIDLVRRLEDAGHRPMHATRTLRELRMKVPAVARMVERAEADAWVVTAGGYDVLRWFAEHPTPAFAMFGRRRGLELAGGGPEKPAAYAEAVRHLVRLGHRRIVLLAHGERRRPTPGASEQAFLNQLRSEGISPSSYHFPDWDDTPEGFEQMLGGLFLTTAPTAMIIDTADLFFAAQQFFLNRGIRVPQDLSLICSDADPYFDDCRPTVAHIRWDTPPLIRGIVRWADRIALGIDDRRQTVVRAEFVEGGTVGPPP